VTWDRLLLLPDRFFHAIIMFRQLVEALCYRIVWFTQYHRISHFQSILNIPDHRSYHPTDFL